MEKKITLTSLQIKFLKEFRDMDAGFEWAKRKVKSMTAVDAGFDVAVKDYTTALEARNYSACVFASSMVAEVQP
jgi:hypothetical protein